MAERGDPGLVDRYLTLGLRLGRHIDGMVDAYYGPPARAQAADREPVQAPDRLMAEARRLLADIDAGGGLDGSAEGAGGETDREDGKG